MPKPKFALKVTSQSAGYVVSLDAKTVGHASQVAGAGRMTKSDKIDLSAGIRLYKKIGDAVGEKEPLAEIYGIDYNKLKSAATILQRAYKINENSGEKRPLIIDIIY